MQRLAKVTDAARIHSRQLLERYGLTAVGVGYKVINGQLTSEPCIKTFVARKLPTSELPLHLSIPRSLAGELTDVEEMAPISVPPWRGLEAEQVEARLLANRARYRPLVPGCSVSHALGTLGTLTGVVSDQYASGTFGVVSCNHVLGQLNRGQFGDSVLQPAVWDGGAVGQDTCGRLVRLSPILFGTNSPTYVDAALARVPTSLVTAKLNASYPAGVRSGNLLLPGTNLYKVGRTTGLTRGAVVATHVSLWVNYPAVLGGANLGYAFFQDQILTTNMAGFGDSGSMVMDEQRRAVGMVFGGTSTHTLLNDIALVEQHLNVRFLVQRKAVLEEGFTEPRLAGLWSAVKSSQS